MAEQGLLFPPKVTWNMTHLVGIKNGIKEHLFKTLLGTWNSFQGAKMPFRVPKILDSCFGLAP